MAYYKKTKDLLRESPKSFGRTLGILAVKAGYSVSKISAVTGASRPTVYRWLHGNGVSPAYAKEVLKLITKLRSK